MMTVKELKQLLEGVDEDMQVIIPTSMEFDGVFVSPCTAESGVGDFAVNEEGDETCKHFALVPHGFFEEHTGVPPELN